MAAIPAHPFDPLFAKHAQAKAIPPAYMRALAYRESGFHPAIVHPQSHATGLFQITKVALDGYNQRSGSSLALAHLVDPDTNTRVAADHLAHVISVFNKHPALKPDWSSRRWVELLTLAWNAGHNALASIAAKLAAHGIPPERITVDAVNQVAPAEGPLARFLADPARARWAKSVAALFLGGGAKAPGAPATPPPTTIAPSAPRPASVAPAAPALSPLSGASPGGRAWVLPVVGAAALVALVVAVARNKEAADERP